MNPMRKFIIIGMLTLCIIPGTKWVQGDVVNVEGEMNTAVTAYIAKRFSSYDSIKNLTYIMYLPSSQTDGINTQTISRLRKTFTPYPTEMNEFSDEYGNSSIELIWNKDIRIVQIDLQFNVRLFSHFYSIVSEAPYPVTVDESKEIFLTSTELSPSNDVFINYIGRTLSHSLSREIDVVKNIFLWLDKNIHLSNKPLCSTHYDALSVLKRREGNVKGICNLAVSMFKGLEIPARLVYGISFQQEIKIKAENQTIFYDYPNGEKYWIEVFFPDLGWISYDPQGTYFGTTSHVIRLSAGPDSDYASDRWTAEQEDLILLKEYIYDIKLDSVKLKTEGYGNEEIDKLVISSIVENFTECEKEPDLSIDELKITDESEELQPGSTGIVLQNSDISQRLDIVATRNRVYAQKVDIDFPIRLTEVKLPLIKFSDEGKIWLEIYSDDNGFPGKVLFKSYSIRSSRIRFMMVENPWLSFPIGKKTNSHLDKGSYWIALRSSGSCIFNWNAYGGNVIGIGRDTIFKDVKLKKPRWNNIVNFDMNFQVIGKREE